MSWKIWSSNQDQELVMVRPRPKDGPDPMTRNGPNQEQGKAGPKSGKDQTRKRSDQIRGKPRPRHNYMKQDLASTAQLYP
jgi:hypothetical protein